MAWAVLYLQCGVKEQLCLLLSCFAAMHFSNNQHDPHVTLL